MRQKKNITPRKPVPSDSSDSLAARKRRNSFDPQACGPHQVDLPLKTRDMDEVVVPATAHGRSMLHGRF